MPFFSVIVPVYNVERYLSDCLVSLETQSFRDWECICVDDGSTDKSASILVAIVRRDARIRIVHQRNDGVSRARNRALDRVAGHFFLFLDSDDGLFRNALQCCVNILSSRQYEALYTPQSVVPAIDDMAFVPRTEVLCVQVERSVENSTDRLNLLLHGGFGVPWGKVFLTQTYGSYRFPKHLMMMEDLVFWEQTLERPGRWGVLSSSFYVYRHRIGSVTRTASIGKSFSAVKSIVQIAEHLESVWHANAKQWHSFWTRTGGIYENYVERLMHFWPDLPPEVRSELLVVMRRLEVLLANGGIGAPFRFRRRLLSRGCYGVVHWITMFCNLWMAGVARLGQVNRVFCHARSFLSARTI